MALKIQVDERDINISITDEQITIPSSSPFKTRLEEVPDSFAEVKLRRISPTVKTGTGSGSCLSGGSFVGIDTKNFRVQIDTAGEIETATFKWSDTGGLIWNTTLVPILVSEPITLGLGITIQFYGGTGQDFNLDDRWDFTAEFWAEVQTIPITTKEFLVNYSNGKITFHSSDAGKTVFAEYDGRGSLVDAEDVNQVISILNQGEVVLRNVDTGNLAACKAAYLYLGVFGLASATDYKKAAIGFVKVSHPINGEVQLFGPMDGFAGLVVNKRYYLSDTEGEITLDPPTEAGHIRQVVGRAMESSRMLVSISQDYEEIPIGPFAIGSAEAFGSPVIQRGSVTISPSAIGSAEAFGTPTVTNP